MPARRLPRPEVVVVDARDFVLARLAVARAAAASTIQAIDDAANAFANPESDKKGRERKELIESALESAATSSRALESAEDSLKDLDADDWNAREPWEEDDEDESDDEDDEDESDDEDDEDE